MNIKTILFRGGGGSYSFWNVFVDIAFPGVHETMQRGEKLGWDGSDRDNTHAALRSLYSACPSQPSLGRLCSQGGIYHYSDWDSNFCGIQPISAGGSVCMRGMGKQDFSCCSWGWSPNEATRIASPLVSEGVLQRLKTTAVFWWNFDDFCPLKRLFW